MNKTTLIIFKGLSIFLVLDLIVIVLALTTGNIGIAILFIGLAGVALGIQIASVKCMSCGCRPGVWLLAIWTLLLDFELYIADTLFLRRCPKCKKDLFE